MNLNDNNRDNSNGSANAPRTSDLVRAVLERARTEKKAAQNAADASHASNAAPLATNTEAPQANVSEAVSRVLRQFRRPVEPASGASSASSAQAAVAAPTVNVPPVIDEYAIPVSTTYDDIPAPPTPGDVPAPSVAANGAPKVDKNYKTGDKPAKNEKKAKATKEPKAKREKKSKAKGGKKGSKAPALERELEASAAGLGALAGAVAGAAAANAAEPNEFLASVALDASVPSQGIALDKLTLTSENETRASTDVFLERLSRVKQAPEEAETAQDTLELLNKKSSLERAADDAPMWLISLIAHLALVLVLAFIVINTDFRKAMEIVSEPGLSDTVVLDEVFDPDATIESTESVEFDAANIEVQSEVVADVPDVSDFNEETAESLTTTDDALGLDAAVTAEVENMLGTLNGSDLSGRGVDKAAALAIGGGSEGSEKSVALALAWIAEHQLPDGSWTYKTQFCPSCGGQCSHWGETDAPNAATAMALLPFLAAGNTPTKGKYKKVVAAGMNWLVEHGKPNENGLSYHESGGTMYSHGLATIALCETFAMLSDRERAKYRELGYMVENAIRFTEYAQADDGGWRYSPKQAGDTSVFGWQMMALKAGQLAGINVRGDVVYNARSFLRDVVSHDYETRYGYTAGSEGSTSTDSIGLLCRLYLDWSIDNESLTQGIERLANQIGPDINNPYYMYYASQLMFNYGGDVWKKWNAKVRDKLIETQSMEGHERGSWWPEQPRGHCDSGGRLFVTAMNCMILEVYYRHMPIYQKVERNDNFPLEAPLN